MAAGRGSYLYRWTLAVLGGGRASGGSGRRAYGFIDSGIYTLAN